MELYPPFEGILQRLLRKSRRSPLCPERRYEFAPDCFLPSPSRLRLNNLTTRKPILLWPRLPALRMNLKYLFLMRSTFSRTILPFAYYRTESCPPRYPITATFTSVSPGTMNLHRLYFLLLAPALATIARVWTISSDYSGKLACTLLSCLRQPIMTLSQQRPIAACRGWELRTRVTCILP